MTTSKGPLNSFSEDRLQECLFEFRIVAPDISSKSEKWLLNVFRKNFSKMLMKDPEGVWGKRGDWVKQQTRAMAHHAMSLALSNGSETPEIDELELALEFIRKAACKKKGHLTARGGWCSG